MVGFKKTLAMIDNINNQSDLSLEKTRAVIEIARMVNALEVPEWIEEIGKWGKVEWGQDTITTKKEDKFEIENFNEGYFAEI